MTARLRTRWIALASVISVTLGVATMIVVNAVMAGCRPDYFPVVLAALDAALDPDFAFQGPGLRLDGVVPGSPADKAGMQAGDILSHLGDSEVNGLGGFNDLLKKVEPGDKVRLRWTRNGTPGQATAELAAR